MSTSNRTSIKTMLEKGQDPKEYIIESCKPGCTALYGKLRRCQATLKKAGDADPELTCMYPFRDWVRCVEECVQPRVHSALIGNQKGWYS